MKNKLIRILFIIYICLVCSCSVKRHKYKNIKDFSNNSLSTISTITNKEFIYYSNEKCDIYIKSNQLKRINTFNRMENKNSDSIYSFCLKIGDRKYYKDIYKDTIYIKICNKTEKFIFEK